MARPIISVIISAKNQSSYLEACFDSLSKQCTEFPFEILLVDNGSTDRTFQQAKKLATQRTQIQVFRERKPGTSSALNFGARRARGEILIFASADCRFSKTWIQELAKPLLAPTHYPLAALSGRTVSEFASPKHPRFLERYLEQLFDHWEQDRLSDHPVFLPWAPSCNFAVRRDVFLGLGGFDQRWKNAAYDIDFSWRLVLCGFVLGHAPKAELRLLHRSTVQGFLRQMKNYAFYNHLLLTTFEKLLGLPKVGAAQERLAGRSRAALGGLSATANFRQATYRAFNALSLASGLTGELQSRLLRLEPNPQLHPTRRGHTPPALEKLLTPGYRYLHAEGWVYWKDPPAVSRPGGLLLFQPKRRERTRLSATAWKIWEVKAERGQSEDAAVAMGKNANSSAVLHNIDELTLDLRTARLLP